MTPSEEDAMARQDLPAESPDPAGVRRESAAGKNEGAPATFRSVLAQRPLRALWLASLISYLGDTFGAMALFILINNVTHSTLALGAVGLADTLPLFLGIIAGVLVDRWRYRPVLLVSDFVRAALVPLYILFRDSNQLGLVLVVAATAAMAARFFSPAS